MKSRPLEFIPLSAEKAVAGFLFSHAQMKPKLTMPYARMLPIWDVGVT